MSISQLLRTARTFGFFLVLLATAFSVDAQQTNGGPQPAYWHLPNAPLTLVQLPNGDRLIYDRDRREALEFRLAAPLSSITILNPRKLGDENAADFAVYDETGRLFRLGPDQPVTARSPVDRPSTGSRIVLVPTVRGGLSALHFGAGGQLRSVTTDSAYFDATRALTRPTIWTHGGQGYRVDLRGAGPIWQHRYGPHRHISMSQSDRFVRKAWRLIDGNLRAASKAAGPAARQDRYWTSGQYRTQDPYYRDFIETLPGPRSLQELENFKDAEEFMGQWVLVSTLLASEFASYPVKFALRNRPIAGTVFDASVDWVQVPIWRVMDPSIISDLRPGHEALSDTYDTVKFVTGASKDVVNVLRKNFYRPVAPVMLQTPIRRIRITVPPTITPRGIRFRQIGLTIPGRRIPALLIGPKRFDWASAGQDALKKTIETYVTDRLSTILSEPAKTIAFGEAPDYSFHYPPKSVKNTFQRLQGLIQAAPSCAQGTCGPTDPGGVEIRHDYSARKANLGGLRQRVIACAAAGQSDCKDAP